jgi:hypothetical protein
MARHRTYGSPQAFRTALTARLRAEAETSRWSLPELQRQFSYDRLLERLYRIDQGWIVKGAAALLARRLALRATVDVDLYRQAGTEAAEEDLRVGADLELGDWFRFEVGRGLSLTGGGIALPVTAYVGQTQWARYKVDLVGSDFRMTDEPEPVPPLADIHLPDVEQHGYRAYPLVDHVADKIAATFERYGPTESPSSRYKDLIDLVAIVKGASVPAQAQMAAVASEATRRGITLPNRFTVPDPASWQKGYAAAAKRWRLEEAKTVDEALAIVRPFIDPVLEGAATGRWNPALGEWV